MSLFNFKWLKALFSMRKGKSNNAISIIEMKKKRIAQKARLETLKDIEEKLKQSIK